MTSTPIGPEEEIILCNCDKFDKETLWTMLINVSNAAKTNHLDELQKGYYFNVGVSSPQAGSGITVGPNRNRGFLLQRNMSMGKEILTHKLTLAYTTIKNAVPPFIRGGRVLRPAQPARIIEYREQLITSYVGSNIPIAYKFKIKQNGKIYFTESLVTRILTRDVSIVDGNYFGNNSKIESEFDEINSMIRFACEKLKNKKRTEFKLHFQYISKR